MKLFVLIACLALVVALVFGERIRDDNLRDDKIRNERFRDDTLRRGERESDSGRDRERDRERERDRDREAPDDIFPNLRVQIKGKFGSDQDNLDTEFEGFSTHIVTDDMLELAHCQGRIVSDDSETDREPRREDEGGKIFHSYAFIDKNDNSMNAFFVLKDNPTDAGQCWSLTGDNANVQLGDWELSDETCGVKNEGKVYTRSSTFTDANGQEIESVMAACKLSNRIGAIAAEHLIQDKPIAAMQARVVKMLPEPDLNERATLLELSVPHVCFTGDAKPVNFKKLILALRGDKTILREKIRD